MYRYDVIMCELGGVVNPRVGIEVTGCCITYAVAGSSVPRPPDLFYLTAVERKISSGGHFICTCN